ncbi:hypothetical protein RJ55_03413 [Drechmeria coniospora]|nr:hypothetical protein RJ55_03413 [Drechmeria coniospora]
MTSLARSFKSSAAYLSPVRRPGIPGRTLSSSSELSLTSTTSGPPGDDAASADEAVVSAPGTPAFPAADAERRASAKPPNSPGGIPFRSCASTSHPITIELPKHVQRHNSSTVSTPLEPLSARGDLPGGYFPMHEDPTNRVHRPHPFHSDTAFARHHLLTSDSAAHATDARVVPKSFPARNPSTTAMAPPIVPVASYLTPGFHDNPLPVGKYYPSNYERLHAAQSRQRARPDDSPSSQTTSDAPVPASGREATQAEARRKMQQYQRDMIAQAALALGDSSQTLSKTGTTISLNGLPLRDSLAAVASHDPASPRLNPLGSPGPVTPMDLDAGRAGYLDKGDGRLMAGTSVPRTAGYAARPT